MIFSRLFGPKTFISETLFFPDEEKEKDVIRYLKYAKKYCYAAIYTITNIKLTRVLYTLFKEGVDVRVITDDETANPKGCNVIDLANAGVPVRTDRNLAARMHHKFIVIDDELMMNGSFNWTVTAVKANNENVVVTSELKLLSDFKEVHLLITTGVLEDVGQVPYRSSSLDGQDRDLSRRVPPEV